MVRVMSKVQNDIFSFKVPIRGESSMKISKHQGND